MNAQVNPYAKAAQRIAAETRQQQAAVVAVEDTPERTAEVIELAARTGAPVGVVRADPEGARQHVERQQLATLQTASPTVAAWLTDDPDRYALARDDLDTAARLAVPLPDWRTLASPTTVMQAPVWIAAHGYARTVSDPMGAIDEGRAAAAAVPRDFVGRTVSGFGQLWNLGERFLDRTVGAGLRALGVPDFDREKIPRWLRLGDSLVDTGGMAKAVGDAIDVPDERRTVRTDIAGAVGQLSGQVVQGIVAPQTLAPSLLAAGADVMAERAEDAGTIGDPVADAGILAGAGVTALAERLGLAQLLKRVPAAVRDQFSRRLLDIATAGGAEAATEVVEGVAQDVLTRALIDDDFQIAEGLEREAIAAGGAGSILRAIIQGVASRRARLQANAEAAHVDALVQAAEASKLKARAPEMLAELVDTAQQGQQVFVPLEALRAHYGDRTEAAVSTLAGPDAYAEAVASGAEVAIPLGRYVATVDRTTHAALRDHMRLTPGEEIRPGTPDPDRVAMVREAMEEARRIDAGEPTPGPEATVDQPLPADAMDADSFAEYLAARQAAQDARQQAREAERQRQQQRAEERRRREEWKATAAEVEAELRTQPVYRAERLLRTGRNPDGTFAETKPKLDAAAVEAFGPKVAERLQGMTVKRGGLSPDAAAALLGYDSGARLVHDLATMVPLRDAVQVETDARMAAQDIDPDPDFADDGTDAQARALEAEIHGLERRAGGIRTHAAILRDVARRFMANKEVAQIRPELYRLAEAKAGREALAAAMKRDWPAVRAARRRQLQALFLHREARDARHFATTSGRRFAQLRKKATRQRIGLAGSDYLEQLDTLLGRFNLAPLTGPQMAERQSLREWIEAKAKAGVLVDVPPVIADEAFRMPLRKLKLGELRELRDAVESIVHAANSANLLRLEGEAIDRREVDEAMAESVLSGNPIRDQRIGGATTGDKLREQLLQARVVLGAATDLARELDGERELGTVWQHTVGVIRKANTAAETGIRQAQEAMAEIKLRHYTKAELRGLTRRDQYVPEIGQAMSRAEILSLALNWGNAGNREAILDQRDTAGRRMLDAAQVGAILSRLDERDWKFVQDVWDHLDSYWPAIAAAERRRTGLAPEKVPPAPFSVRTADGREIVLRGGYYPLKYDNATVKTMREEAADFYDAVRFGKFTRAQTAKGHTKERIGSGGRTVRLDLGVIDQHLRAVNRDLHLGDAVNYVHRVLHGDEFAAAVNATGNVERVRGLELWLQDVAAGEMVSQRNGEQVVRSLRKNFTAAVLTFKATTAALQATGVLQSAAVLGRGPMLEAELRVMRHPVAMYRHAVESSPFMARRVQTHIERVQAVVDAEAGIFKQGQEAMFRAGYFAISRVQAMVDVTTWIAAEKVGLERFGGDLDKARAFADDIVSRTQGSGEFVDKTAIQRGTLSEGIRQTEYIRGTTMLMGYLLTKQNAMVGITRRTDFRKPKEALLWFANMLNLYVWEGMAAMLIRGGWPSDEDDDGSTVDEWIAAAATEAAGTLFGAIPGVSMGVSELRGYDAKGVVADAWESVGRALQQIRQGELDTAFFKAHISLAGFALGVPSSQINKTLDAIAAADDGKDVSPIEYLTGPQD